MPRWLVAGVVYLNALDNPFIYDDHVLIGENHSLVAPLNLPGLVLQDLARPVINVSYAVDSALWGPSPFGFHLTNVLLHMFNVALLFILAMSALRFNERRADETASSADNTLSPVVAASVAALLLAVHPMMTGAVGYISGRSEVFCTTWLLLALLSAQRWVRTAHAGWLAATAGLWLLALATKETAAMFPLVLLLYDRLVIPTVDRAERRRRGGVAPSAFLLCHDGVRGRPVGDALIRRARGAGHPAMAAWAGRARRGASVSVAAADTWRTEHFP